VSVTTDQDEASRAVLAWLVSPAASKFAVKRLRSSGFSEAETLAPDVVGDACIKVVQRFRAAGDFAPDNPEAYATTIIRNLVHRLNRGETDGLDGVDLEAAPWTSFSETDNTYSDQVRVVLEQSRAEPWLTSAALACVCFIGHPDTIPATAPTPKSGATPEQAQVWPALWFAGQRDLFPGDSGDPHKRTRARRIKRVLAHLGEAYDRFTAGQVRTDG